MRKYLITFVLLLFLVFCSCGCYAASFSNSEVLQTISDYYELGIENYQILTGYSNSYSTYDDFMSQLDNYKYFMVEYIVTSNSSYIYIYYGNQMWFDSNLNKVHVKNGRSGQFIIKENFQGGKTKKSILRNIISYSNSEFSLDTSTQKYYIFNCATSVNYNDYFAKQGGFSGDEIFNIKNENGQSIINTTTINFIPSNDDVKSIYINGLYRYVNIQYFNRPPRFWKIGILENFDVNEDPSPYFSEYYSNGSYKLFNFSSYEAYSTWSNVREGIYVDGMNLKYNVVYAFNLIDGNTVSSYYFMFLPLKSQGLILDSSGDYVYSGDFEGYPATTEDYLNNLNNSNFSGDLNQYSELVYISGDVVEPFYINFINKLNECLLYSGDAILTIHIYDDNGNIDHDLTFHSSQANWDLPLLPSFFTFMWLMSFGYSLFIFIKDLYDKLTSGEWIESAEIVDNLKNVL